ncbi:type II toxin-antitoxin system Phd/YefM family antitoxin [Vibrio jasicida]|uniref:type II toxin-antitoxin system Phd/YefM family antitoxin n=1 Tax=Vibrio jasicida TaxID=766224 RepID=UPI001CA475E7|nr:type II toxin-antitoxin system Phd/YefM family antitoxin [Vibrio jasicida]
MSYTDVRSSLKGVYDKVIDDCDTMAIHRRNAENVLMISESEYSGWKEAIHLMSNPVNAMRLMESIASAERGEAKEYSHVLW